MENLRLKPVCLIIIDNFSVDYLSNDHTNFLYFKKIAEIFPYFMIKSTDTNVDLPYNSYIEMGTGSCIKDDIIRISLPQIISDAGLRQLYIAESELYPNITYFFNNKNKFADQKINSICISETKSDSYLRDSDMMANSLTSKFLKEIDKKIYDFAVLGYSNFIGKDVNLEFTSSVLCQKIKSVVDTILALNGAVFITSNTSLKKDQNFVPLLMISKSWESKSFIDHNHFKPLNQQVISGNVYDIAPTILKVMGISKPQEMRGSSLI